MCTRFGPAHALRVGSSFLNLPHLQDTEQDDYFRRPRPIFNSGWCNYLKWDKRKMKLLHSLSTGLTEDPLWIARLILVLIWFMDAFIKESQLKRLRSNHFRSFIRLMHSTNVVIGTENEITLNLRQIFIDMASGRVHSNTFDTHQLPPV